MEKLIKEEMINSLRMEATKANMNINSYDLSGTSVTYIGQIRVLNNTDGPLLYLDDKVTKSYFAEWKKDVGGIFLKDLKKRKYENLFEVTGESFRCIVRRIPEDEVDEMTQLGFNHFTYGDYTYTIIRFITDEESYGLKEINLINEVLPVKIDEEDNYEYVEEPAEDFTSATLYDE